MTNQELKVGMKAFIEKHFGTAAKWKAEFKDSRISCFKMNIKSLNKVQVSILLDLCDDENIDLKIARSGTGLKIELNQN